jgi:hypothetical protein
VSTWIVLLIAQGVLGALDTAVYHEYLQRLPQRPTAALELRLHAARDFAYAALFGSLAWVQWNGAWTVVLVGVLVLEIVITLWDFVEEDRKRPLPAGERIGHSIMAILYGAFLAFFVPDLLGWIARDTGFTRVDHGWVSWLMTLMSIGVFAWGIRDVLASKAIVARAAAR